MNDTNWKFPTTSSAVEVQATTASSFNGGGLANALDNSNATSLKSVTRCPKHNLPQDIPPPPSLTKAASLHNCNNATVAYYSAVPDEEISYERSARFPSTFENERAQSAEFFNHRRSSTASESVLAKVKMKDDTTQCNSVSNNNGMNGPSGIGSSNGPPGGSGGGPSSNSADRRASARGTGPRRFRRRKPMCLRATLANFSTFCRQTSLHGWQYIAQKNGSSAKHMFWAIIVSMSMATAALFLYNNTVDYLNATVVTTVDTMTVPLSEVFFPSVVVCNINQVRKSFFEELGIYDNETFIRQIYYDYIEGKSKAKHHSESGDYDDGHPEKKIALHEKILKEYLERINMTAEGAASINWITHQKCQDMFVLSKWNGSTTYEFAIERDFGTDYGICCWYTPQHNLTEVKLHQEQNNLSEPDWGFWFQDLPKGAKTGKDNGYTMLFDIESFDYSYYDEGSEGLKVALVHHLDMPIMRQTGFHIAPGTENQIAVTPTLIVTSNNAMHRFTPAERDCYSEDEISLKYLPRDHGYRYEMSNCLFESAFEYILHECKCYPGFHNMGGEEAKQHFSVCIGPNLTCMNDVLNRMGQFDHVEYEGKKVKCRSNCEDQINSLFVTTSSYPNRKTLIYREEFCIVAKRLIEKCKGPKRKPLEREYPNLCNTLEPLTRLDPTRFCKNNAWDIPRSQIPNCTNRKCPVEDSILSYARENLVMFNIFIKDPYAKRFQKDEKITKTSYIANSGGLLGLCMGFSLISAAEILFHCFFGIYSGIFPSEKKKQRLKNAAARQQRQAETHHQHAGHHALHHPTTSQSVVATPGGASHHHCGCSHYSPSEFQVINSASSVKNDISQNSPFNTSNFQNAEMSDIKHCCNFQHIVQLQDGTTRSVLCSNLNLARMRHQLTTCQVGNGSCLMKQQTNSCHSATTTERNAKEYSGPERII